MVYNTSLLPQEIESVVRASGLQCRFSVTPLRGIPRERKLVSLGGVGTPVRYLVHKTCVANLVSAVAERIFYAKDDGVNYAPVILPTTDISKRLSGFKCRLVGFINSTPGGVYPWAEDQFLDACATGRKRTIYQQAFDSLRVEDVKKRDAYISAFVKVEKVVKVVPRIICPRTPRYCAALGLYIKRIEKLLVAGVNHVFGHVTLVKGLNYVKTGEAMHDAWASLSNPVAIELDASRFDQHVSKAMLNWEHSIYNAVYRNDPRLRRLLSWQLVNRGRGSCNDGRVNFLVDGHRMSGDMNTGIGNCVLMCAMIWQYLKDIGISARLINNGDDCCLMVEDKDVARVTASIEAWFREFGFVMKVEGIKRMFCQINFCQTRPMLDSGRAFMIRDPIPVLSKDLVTTRWLVNQKAYDVYRRAIAECGLAAARDIPVMDAYYNAILRGAEHAKQVTSGLGLSGHTFNSGVQRQFRGITAELREQFFWMTGMTPDHQVAIERYYNSVKFEWKAPVEVKSFDFPVALSTWGI